ncbi:beta-galactosidase domain 4-containing protein [Streptomyces sp. NBC_01618]|uniref:beta-galactosidase domain 4-containing protein n=1 Tax=Streptomyces sp. NBC_01618 TaxID=2975900 RepID=UPI00386E51FE
MVRNLHHTRDTGYLRWTWRLEADGVPVADGEWDVSVVVPGAQDRADWPDSLAKAVDTAGRGEHWLTVSAELAADEPWADVGHTVTWTQIGPVADSTSQTVQPDASPRRGDGGRLPVPRRDGDTITLGAARFDAITGTLVRLGELPVYGPRADVWRAPIDNDRVSPLGAAWQQAGLDRLRHKVLQVETDDDGITVRTRMSPAGSDLGLLADYHWSAQDGNCLVLTVDTAPLGPWPVPLPRLGVAMTVPGEFDRVTWFGLGPGEAYRDSDSAVRVGRYESTVEAMQTPYVRPQENGNRRHLRWARLTRSRLGGDGTEGTDGSGGTRGTGGTPSRPAGYGTCGIEITGSPWFDLTVKPWSTQTVQSADHTVGPEPDGLVHLDIDLEHRGLGSGSCGPSVQPRHHLAAVAARFTLRIRPVEAEADDGVG